MRSGARVNKAVIRTFMAHRGAVRGAYRQRGLHPGDRRRSAFRTAQNRASILQEARIERGDIQAYDGSVIAGSTRSGLLLAARRTRWARSPRTSWATTRCATAAAASSRHGRRPHGAVDAISACRAGWTGSSAGRPPGATVRLTLVPGVQHAAQQALRGTRRRHRGRRPRDRRRPRLRVVADVRRRRHLVRTGRASARTRRAAPEPAHAGALPARAPLSRWSRPARPADRRHGHPGYEVRRHRHLRGASAARSRLRRRGLGRNDLHAGAHVRPSIPPSPRSATGWARKRLIAGAHAYSSDSTGTPAAGRCLPARSSPAAATARRAPLAPTRRWIHSTSPGRRRSGAGCSPLHCRWRWWRPAWPTAARS